MPTTSSATAIADPASPLARATDVSPGGDLTPYLRLDLSVVRSSYDALTSALPGTEVRYAVKANPHPGVLRVLAEAGSGFDVASPAEVSACLDAGAPPGRLLYSNPIKRRVDLRTAYDLGVRLFVVDCVSEMHKVADEAPGSSVLCRLLTSGAGSDWPLSRKYGCSADAALEILTSAAARGLAPAGMAFHVGSQQRDPESWRAPIATAAGVFGRLERLGFRPWLLDLGGGFPARHEGDLPALSSYGDSIRAALWEAFGIRQPATVIEPGRAVVADAGVLHATVVAVCWRGGRRWVYLDAGVFTGLVETLDEAIRYRLETDRGGDPAGPVVLAGPTCDSADVLYERRPALLPLTLNEGDEVRLLSAGAYTSCYSTVGFNGFPPLPTRLLAP